MSEPREVWAVTTGSYSDYKVRALFSSKKLAEAAAKATAAEDDDWNRDARVTSFLLYDEMPEPATEWVYQADIWDTGIVTDETLRSKTRLPWTHLYGLPPLRPNVRYVRAPVHKNKGGRLEVRGSDEQGVKQAFGDNKARILAEKAGVS